MIEKKTTSSFAIKKSRFDFADELKIGESFDVYHMKCNFPQKRTVYELSAIQKRWSSSKKAVFRKKCAKIAQ